MKRNILVIVLLSLLTSCLDQKPIPLPGLDLSHRSEISKASISRVNYIDDQLQLIGSNLNVIKRVSLEDNRGALSTLSIDAQTNSTIFASASSAIRLGVGKMFSLVLADAYGATSYEVSFELDDAQVQSNHIAEMGASSGQVLKFNGSQWTPGDLDGLTYAGTWDASTGTAPTFTPSGGEYYIVSTQGANVDLGDGQGSRDWLEKDWIVYNSITNQWDKISNVEGDASYGSTGASPPNKIYVIDSGNVGIGTTTPASSLDISGEVAVTASSGTAISVDQGNQTNVPVIRFTNLGPGDTGMKLGNLSIGGTTGKLHKYDIANNHLGYSVRGGGAGAVPAHKFFTDAGASSALTSVMAIMGGGPGADLLSLQKSDSSQVFKVEYDGNVGVGVDNPDYKLDVNGSVNISVGNSLRFGGTSVCTSAGCTSSSDARLKEDILPLENSLKKILSLKPVSYEFIDERKFGTSRHVGFVAQALERQFPEVVVRDPDTGLLAVAYAHLVAPIIQAVQELYQLHVHERGLIESNSRKGIDHEKTLKSLSLHNRKLEARLKSIEEEVRRLKLTLENSHGRRD